MRRRAAAAPGGRLGRSPATSTPVVAAALCASWGMSFVVYKVGLDESGPAWFAALRAAISALPLLPTLVLVRGLGGRGHALAAGLGTTNVAGFFGFQLAGLERVDAGVAAPLLYTQPLLVLVAAHLLLGEEATTRRYAGALLGFAGVAVVGLREASVGSAAGVAFLLVAAALWTAGTLLLKIATDKPLLPLVAAQNLYGTGPLVVYAAVREPFPGMTATLALTLVYAGIVASTVGWLLQAVLLRRGDAGVVSSYIFSVPLLGAFFAVLLLDEPLHASLVVGVVLVAVGVRLVTADPRLRVQRAREPPGSP